MKTVFSPLKEKYNANCRDCNFCERAIDNDSTKFFCRKNPPALVPIVKTNSAGIQTTLLETHWPEVQPNDRCGCFSHYNSSTHY